MAEPHCRCESLAARGLVEIVATDDAVESIGKMLGLVLHNRPTVSVTGNGYRADWLAPWRWLLHTRPGAEAALVDRLQTRSTSGADGALLAVVVSDAWSGYRITGSRAADLIAEGCTLDLMRFTDDVELRCARTVLARAPVLLATAEDRKGLEVWVDSAYSCYLGDWLAGAAARVSF